LRGTITIGDRHLAEAERTRRDLARAGSTDRSRGLLDELLELVARQPAPR